jgi:hypothetical protein
MGSSTPSVTVGIYPRDRFSLAGQALRRIMTLTHVPFSLAIIDCGTPKRYLKEMEDAVAGHPDVRWIRADRFLTPGESRNRIVAETTGEYLCLIENDCLVDDGWLDKMLAAAEKTGADLVVPLVFERFLGRFRVHHDAGIGAYAVEERGGKKYRTFTEADVQHWAHFSGPTAIGIFDTHCNLFRRHAIARIGGFDEILTTRTPVDLIVRVGEARLTSFIEPSARVRFMQPPPVEHDELPLYRFLWDAERAKASNEHMLKKWGLEGMPISTSFASGQLMRKNWIVWTLWRTWRGMRRAWLILIGRSKTL